MITFEGLGLDSKLIQATDALGFKNPTPIQEKAIPVLLSGTKDLVGLCTNRHWQNSCIWFTTSSISRKQRQVPASSYIVCPTRELCMQIVNEMELFKKFVIGMNVLAVYGGTPIGAQIRELKRGVQIVVATPGRLIDLIERKAINLEK